MPNTLFTNSSQTRFTLASKHSDQPYNWLFLPGGPGMSASYLQSLVDTLELPGSAYLIDLPANGDHISADIPAQYDFDQWSEHLLAAVREFENPILVGHSFGGMYPLLFPELENILKGFVILNSSPRLWQEAAAKVALERQLPSITAEITEMMQRPCHDTAMTALLACAPYYFLDDSLAAGRKLLADTAFNCFAAIWWFNKIAEINFNAHWIPEKIPTLIIGAEYDAMTPFSLFSDDARFHRGNIQLTLIKNAGHMPWIENPKEVKHAILGFIKQLILQ